MLEWGDVVKHYSQPVPLTVYRIDGNGVWVYWFDDSWGMQQWNFPEHELYLFLKNYIEQGIIEEKKPADQP